MSHWVIRVAQRLGIPLDVPFLSTELQKAGYSTHLIGKWHLGHYHWEYTPLRRGFDTFYGQKPNPTCAIN